MIMEIAYTLSALSTCESPSNNIDRKQFFFRGRNMQTTPTFRIFINYFLQCMDLPLPISKQLR